MRVELAKILLKRPDLLLLDEPTNHLDIVSITWLEEWIESYPGALVLVSHDRAFLDNVTNRTIEIMNARIYDYKAGYSDYVLLREEQISVQMAAMENQQRQIAQIERFVERFRYKSTKSRQVQSRIKMLEKMDTIDVDVIDQSSIYFKFPQAPHAGKVIFDAEKISKSYGKLQVLKNLNFKIINSDKIAFVGRNGEGKTTLSRILTGELDFIGKITPGHKIQMGYFAQNQAAMLNGEITVFQTLDEIAVGEVRPKIRAILGSFLFGGDAIDKKVKVLSGGEKTRLALAKLLLTPYNVLVLDEPTNHLDMLSKDILKSALLEFNGTLIIVSHDRDFLQGLTNRVFEFRNQQIYEHIGDVYDFLESRKLSSLKDLETAALNTAQAKNEALPTDNQLYREKKKGIDRDRRKISQQIEEIENRIASAESSLEQMDNSIANPDNAVLHTAQFYKKYDEDRKTLDRYLHEWEELHSRLDALDNSIL
jgi:ATP-binding cassette subfamily F protein 3